MASKKDPEPTAEHQEAVSDQVETHRGEEQETGPDPIIERIKDLDLPQLEEPKAESEQESTA